VAVTVRRAMGVTALASFVIVLLIRDPAPAFLYDAGTYWRDNQLVLGQHDPWMASSLRARGVLTAFAYLPAAAATNWLGIGSATSVLVMNALVIALLGAGLIPALVSRVTDLRIRHLAASGVLTTALLSGFAPYPLMDLVSVGLLLLGILLLDLKRPLWNVLGGALLAVAVNLRTAHIACVVVMVVLYAALRRWRVISVVAGVVVGCLPQALYNAHWGFTPSALPPLTRVISETQFRYAGYGVRYDTLAYADQDPRQWFCHPAMARGLDGDLPTGTAELLKAFVQNLPASAGFALEKVVGTLQWVWETPYAGPGTPGWTVLGVLTLLVCVVGLAGLLVSRRLVEPRRPSTVVVAMLVAMVAGTVVTLVGSAPETRFALPIVAAGIVGTTLLATARMPEPGRRHLVLFGVAVGVSAAVLLPIGIAATSHPLEPGDMTTADCLDA
jgi:hypothetical protein